MSTTDVERSEDQQTAFLLELSQDQRYIRDWVHGFAAGVVRPAASEWDEREQTPWPVIREAAKIGLYGFEAMGTSEIQRLVIARAISGLQTH